MSDNRSAATVLFANGVTTHFGGSGFQAVKSWQKSFEDSPLSCVTWNISPLPRKNARRWLYNLGLFFLFLPGTFFRVFRSPVFEMLYKISPVSIVGLLSQMKKFQPIQVVLSHHAAFYLAFFVPKEKRCLLIHDLLCVRAASMGASRRTVRRTLRAELAVYSKASKLMILSYHEARILRKFLPNVPVDLLSCYDPQLGDYCPPETYDGHKLAIISDWRRQENLHGLQHFFEGAPYPASDGTDLQLSVWGFAADRLAGSMGEMPAAGCRFSFHGPYDTYADVKEGISLVPIYQGAGIKLKTLEAFRHHRFVVGTNGAFIGIPPILLRDVSMRIRTPADLAGLPATLESANLPANFDTFWENYPKWFATLAEILYRWSEERRHNIAKR